jgi:uncharacterized protein
MLQFDRIRRISRRLLALGIPFFASMVTNGYLLDAASIEEFTALKIRGVQVTLDGPEDVHDSRRHLAGGGPTFRTILANLDRLLDRWSGTVQLRVNVDRTNADAYHLVRRQLVDRFPGKKLLVYPGIVHAWGAGHPDLGCLFDRDQVAAFYVDQYRRHGVDDLRFYPQALDGGCVATMRNGFVIGPEGEVYKCWHHIGRPEKVVGTVRAGVAWNMGACANYAVGTDNANDAECRDCFYLPICDGGCAELRYRKRFEAADIAERPYACVRYKDHLDELLEVHYQLKLQKEAQAAHAGGDQAVGS